MAATVEEHAAKLSADFKIKECPAFVHFAGKQSRGAKVLAFNDAEIPLTAEAFNGKKQVNVGFVLVDCLSEGFSRVPYMNTGGALKATNDAKPLTEKSLWPEDPDKQLSQMTCYPYGIIEGHPQEKNQRNEEYKWNLFPGKMMFSIPDRLLCCMMHTPLCLETCDSSGSQPQSLSIAHKFLPFVWFQHKHSICDF